RPAHAITASPAASGPITSFAETVISEALAKAEVYRSFAAFLDTELARFSVVSPAHARLHFPYPNPPTRKATLPQSDGRVFLRLDKDSPFTNNDAFAIRKEVQSLLRLAPTDIPGCHKVPSGFALVPKNDAVRQTLLAHKDEIGARFGCVQVEVPK
ncbi:hypothetical protein B0H65DRAFT_387794, partial [Neurospora tetraspora]